jgi:hypothetical protein
VNSSATELLGLLRKYAKEKDWVMLDCFNIWLHNQSGVTARIRFPDLVLECKMNDFHYNLNFRYANKDIEKAVYRFKEDLKEFGLHLLSDTFSIHDQTTQILKDIMISRILNEIASEEERRILFIFGKYYSSQSSDFYASIGKPGQFEISLKGLYSASFGEETKVSILNFLCKLGIILRVNWVVSRRPESYEQWKTSSWAKDFLDNIENYITIRFPEITDKIEAYMQLISEKKLISQLIFFDLLLEKDLLGRVTFLKSELYVKDQLESLIPGSYSNVQFRLGIVGKSENLVFISPLVRNKIADALRSVKKDRTAGIEKLIEKTLNVFQDQKLYDVKVILDNPKTWRIDGIGTSLLLVVLPWCKFSDVPVINELSTKANSTVVFIVDQKLPILKTLFKENPKISFCFIMEDNVCYTEAKDEIFKIILDKFDKDGYATKQVESKFEEIKAPGEQYFSLPIEYEKYTQRIMELLRNSKNQISMISPYIDDTTFSEYISLVPNRVQVKIITSNIKEENKAKKEWENLVKNGLTIYVKKLKLTEERPEVKEMIALHGRYLIVDDSYVIPSMPDLKKGASGLEKGEHIRIATFETEIKAKQKDFKEYWESPEEKLTLDINTETWNPKKITS